MGISNGIRYFGLSKPNLVESYVIVPYHKVKESLKLEEIPWYLGSFGQVNCLCPSSMPAAYCGGHTPDIKLSEWLISGPIIQWL